MRASTKKSTHTLRLTTNEAVAATEVNNEPTNKNARTKYMETI